MGWGREWSTPSGTGRLGVLGLCSSQLALAKLIMSLAPQGFYSERVFLSCHPEGPHIKKEKLKRAVDTDQTW